MYYAKQKISFYENWSNKNLLPTQNLFGNYVAEFFNKYISFSG